MKNIVKLIIITLFFTNCKAQTVVNIGTYNQGDNSNKYFKDLDHNYNNFIGTWENTTGNITFRVILWKETKVPLLIDKKSYIDEFNGSFKIIQDLGTTNEIVLHNSVKYYPQSNTTSNSVITARSGSQTTVAGNIVDTCANGGNGIIEGTFNLTITSIGSFPSVGKWKIYSRPLHQNESFAVPTDIILTKVN